jgi:hypothetical protein
VAEPRAAIRAGWRGCHRMRARFALRACVLRYGTTEADVDALPDAVRRAARLVAPSGP